ncbi:MAG: nitrogen fixation protein NifD [Candidatus Adiutrix intracellularis]|jgi:nitrogen regulatory protein PII 1|nr:MAG: nitrogen fixation protein NifD [Candidatus Adiutrix intracellularis]MDR2827145.1 P-II family nitrogen regulator [Candidatus Adiutrix intracellularis]
MKMVRAVVRPESTELIVDSLAESGFVSMTKVQVFGRGKQKGLDVGTVHYDELPKNMLIMVIEDENVDKVMEIIQQKARTGNFGDGKIFITPVERIVTIRTGIEGL